VLGGLRSLPIVFVGGLLLGVVQDLVAGYDNQLPKFIAKDFPWVNRGTCHDVPP